MRVNIQNAIQLENDFHPILYQRWMAKVLHKSVKALDFTLRLIFHENQKVLLRFRKSTSNYVHSSMILSHHMLSEEYLNLVVEYVLHN